MFSNLIVQFKKFGTIGILSINKVQKPINLINVATMKYIPDPPKIEVVGFPEVSKLKIVPKQPLYPGNIKPPKMTKKLKLIRGPEMVHNKLIHKQYGIIALSGGQLKFGHYNMIQTIVGKNLNYDKSFCIWRIDPPNRSVTKHGQGKKLGGGKGTIDHYMYPVKRGRVIIEVGGNTSFQEVSRMLQQISEKLPFPAKVVNREMMENFEKEEEKLRVENVNKLRWEWAIKNNLLNCLTYAGKYDIEFSHLGPDCR